MHGRMAIKVPDDGELAMGQPLIVTGSAPSQRPTRRRLAGLRPRWRQSRPDDVRSGIGWNAAMNSGGAYRSLLVCPPRHPAKARLDRNVWASTALVSSP